MEIGRPRARSWTSLAWLAAAALLLAFAAPRAGAVVPPPDAGAGPAPLRLPDCAPRHHNAGDATCGDCHLVNGAEAAASTEPRANPALLRYADPLDLCLSCHDGRPGIPDVLGADVNGLADRAAGCFLVVDGRDGRGHPLGHGTRARSGGDRVTCIDCHDPHGNHVARNLRADGAALGLFVDPSALGLSRYESSRVRFGTVDDDRLREVSRLCLGCHPDHGDALAPGPDGALRHVHHPVYDSRDGATNTIAAGERTGATHGDHWESGRGSGFESVARVPVVVRGATGYAAARGASADRSGVFCLSCHKAHGSCQPFGLLWPIRAGGSATGCEQCHDHAGGAD